MTGPTVRLEFTLEITVRTPFLFRGNAGASLGYDEAMLRDPQGRPLIPGDQVKGLLRHTWDSLIEAAGAASLPSRDELFGTASRAEESTTEGDVPLRGMISVSDLTAALPGQEANHKPDTAYRVEIDDTTGAAKTGALQVIEQVAAPGLDILFKGKIVLLVEKARADQVTKALRAAFGMIQSIGAMKSAGFGAAVSVRLSDKPAETALTIPASPKPRTGTRFAFDVTFDRPVLADAQKLTANNAFLGAEILPGAVFKGALGTKATHFFGRTWPDEFSKALAALHFTHAYPVAPGTPATQAPGLPRLPLSMIALKQQKGQTPELLIRDALGGTMQSAALINGLAPFHPIDWKDSWYEPAYAAAGLAGLPERPAHARTRTAIQEVDEQKQLTGDAVLDGQLFTLIARNHTGADGTPHAWRFEVDLAGLDSSLIPAAHRLLDLLESGLDGVGKTDAIATLQPLGAVAPPAARHMAGRPGCYALVLRSPAVMHDLASLHDADGNWCCSPDEAYAAYWAAVLPGAKLETFFASQRLAGGYLAHRRRLYGRDTYYPFLLTEPGSVFLLSNADEAAINRLLRTGLPLPAFPAASVSEVTWQNCPFVPENGYGSLYANYLSDQQVASRLFQGVTHV